ncbi:hypothetical protein RLW55_16760 [Hyphomicrobium sp. B1]|uniref:hypothetical protein n=1 Tax=Hyphomicrobium sp. B1 TaxID=3075651 RepID=UPI003C2D682E
MAGKKNVTDEQIGKIAPRVSTKLQIEAANAVKAEAVANAAPGVVIGRPFIADKLRDKFPT